MALHPDGHTFVTEDTRKTLILWDVATRQPLGPEFVGHQGEVHATAFSPDGEVLATAGADKTIILWDVVTGQPLGPALIGHTGGVTSVAFSPDGMVLASGSDDTTIQLWDMSKRSWRARACGIANRNLTKAEWDQYIGAEVPYHHICPMLPASGTAVGGS
jgi:WD40 repeat protein